MIFNSFTFLWLFPLIFILYYTIIWSLQYKKSWGGHSKVSNVILLVVSYCLYAKGSPVWCLFLFLVTSLTYVFARIIEYKNAYGNRKYIIIGAILAFLPLFVFKYYNFFSENINVCLKLIGIAPGLPGLNWSIPLGISFFSFQAVGYLFDVYYKRIKAERNFFDYMLFVSFFPQIVSGPISKAKDLLPQIKADRHFDYTMCVRGLKWLLWGFFLKTVVADRLGIYVDLIFNHYTINSGASCLLASFLYAFQIYADFSGYSLMAIGVGALMGFKMVNNFQRPYLSVSVTDFWHRWHISLSTWLKDYIYIPLGGNRCSKARNYFNIFITFLVSGIWHGANWTFILWGSLHGFYQIIEKFLGLQKYERINVIRFLRIMVTFILVTFAWIFFRMPSISDAILVINKIFTDFPSHVFIDSGVDVIITFIPLLIFIAKDLTEEFTAFSLFNNRNVVVRWASYLVVLFSILLFGVLDASSFIYASF